MTKAQLAPLLVALVLLSTAILTGCEDDDVGYLCNATFTPSTEEGDTGMTYVKTTATDCRSRLCIVYAINVTDAKPKCTKICEQDSDCPSNFVCRSVESFHCCKMCIDKNYDLQSGSGSVDKTTSCNSGGFDCSTLQ